MFVHKMDKQTIAAFVENETILSLANQYKIDYAQSTF